MYSFYLQSFAGLVNVAGTVFAVLSILKMKPSEIYRAITLDGIDHGDKDRLIQKKQARVGIGLVVIGWVLQVVFGLVSPTTECAFWISLGCGLLVIIVWFIISYALNRRLDRQYKEYYAEQSNHESTHKDTHSWGKF